MADPMFVEIADAIAAIWPEGRAPTLRTVREDMDRHGLVIRKGRCCFTTRKYIEAYKEIIRCVGTEQSSKQFGAGRKTGQPIGRRAVSSRSGDRMALSPENELKLALAATQQRRGRQRLTA